MTSAEATIVVTLDIGGSAAKASGYDTGRQISLGSTAVSYPAAPAGQDPGMFDPDGWWMAAVGALRELRELLDEPTGRYLGITVSAIRIPFVLLDERAHAVMPGLLNRDRRAAPQVADLVTAIGGDELYRTTGHWPAPEFGLPKLLWVREAYPSAWHATRTVLQLHDWFIHRLSGVLASERSSAAMSQLIDVRKGSWASGLLATLGISASLLPELRQAGSAAGGLLPDVAAATGFAPGTPVHIGGGDTHMSALSAAPITPAMPRRENVSAAWAADLDLTPVVVAGTTAPVLLAMPALELPHDTENLFPLLVSDHLVPGMKALEANAGPTGMIADLLEDLPVHPGDLRGQLEARGLRVDEGDCGDDPVVLAGNPFFGPEGWECVPPPTVIGLREWHGRQDVVRACLRGICYAIRSVLECLAQRSGVQPGPVVATGGMSRSTEWAQLLADVTGQPVVVPGLDRIAGKAGAAIVASLGLADADRDRATERRTFTPDPRLADHHAVGLANYRALYRAAQLDAQRWQVTDARTR